MSDQTKLKNLQLWCKKMTEGYRDVDVKDMSASWKSGLAFCAIIHRFRPDLIDYDSLSKENIRYNNQLAFEVAERELGILALLEADDMVTMRVPDRLCVITYVASYYNYFRNKDPSGGPGIRKFEKKEGKTETVKAKTSKALAPLQASNQDFPEDTCSVCQKKVFVMERRIENGKLYHRSCFMSAVSPSNSPAKKKQEVIAESKEQRRKQISTQTDKGENKKVDKKPEESTQKITKQAQKGLDNQQPPDPVKSVGKIAVDLGKEHSITDKTSHVTKTTDQRKQLPEFTERFSKLTGVSSTASKDDTKPEMAKSQVGSDKSEVKELKQRREEIVEARQEKKNVVSDDKQANKKKSSSESESLTSKDDSSGAMLRKVGKPSVVQPSLEQSTKGSNVGSLVRAFEGSLDSTGTDIGKKTLPRKSSNTLRRSSRSRFSTSDNDEKLSIVEIRINLQELDFSLKQLESDGRKLEVSLRETTEETEEALMNDWLKLVAERNDLVRKELYYNNLYHQRELETQQRRVDQMFRVLDSKPDKTEEEIQKDEELMKQHLQLVNRRSAIIDQMEEERQKEIEEDTGFAKMKEDWSKTMTMKKKKKKPSFVIKRITHIGFKKKKDKKDKKAKLGQKEKEVERKVYKFSV